MNTLNRQLSRTFGGVQQHLLRVSHPWLLLGLEHRTVPAEYQWDGLKRGSDPAQPEILWQYTLGGYGRFVRDGKRIQVPVGNAFLALLPSKHSYGLPPESPEWRFFWMTVRHPYLVERMSRFFEGRSPVQSYAFDGATITAALALAGIARRGDEPEPAEVEILLFRWMIELEREIVEQERPYSKSRKVLEEYRAAVVKRLPRVDSVAQIAEQKGMSRSAFSHYFRNATGMSPAAYATDVRLAEAEQLLRTGNLKLESIAKQTGFADAGHFCKVFRRRYGISPGAWRGRIEIESKRM